LGYLKNTPEPIFDFWFAIETSGKPTFEKLHRVAVLRAIVSIDRIQIDIYQEDHF